MPRYYWLLYLVIGDISHCAAFSGAPQVSCEAAAQAAPAPFDDGLMGAPAMAPGYAPGGVPLPC